MRISDWSSDCALPIFRRPRPRDGCPSQLGDHRRDDRTRGLSGREADRLPGVRRARPPAPDTRSRPMNAHPPRVTFEPVDVERDAALLHEWVTHPRSVYWMMSEAKPAEVAVASAAIAANPHTHTCLQIERAA